MLPLKPFRRRNSITLGLALLLTYGLIDSPAEADSIDGTSSGGTGDWEDPSTWTFDSPPSTATIPDNDGTDFFTVRIDGGAGASTRVSLTSGRTVDHVEIDAGDTLAVGGSATLTIATDPARLGSGQIANSGVFEIGDSISASSLLLDGNTSFSGTGVLRLADFANSRIVPTAGAGLVTLRNEVGHRIEGGGLIEADRLENHGTIVANGNNSLRLRSIAFGPVQGFIQQGTLEVTGSGGLDLSGVRFTNEGTIRTTGGEILFDSASANSGLIEILGGQSSTSQTTTSFQNELGGTFRVQGTGNSFTTGDLRNNGLIEALDGAQLNLSRASGGGLWRIANGSVLAASQSAGVQLELDNGTLISPAVAGSFTGNGSIVSNSDVQVNSVTPGLSGAGLIEIESSATIRDFFAEIGGVFPGQHDRLAVAGNVVLRGTVDVSLIDGFSPALGDHFDLITGTLIDWTVSRELDEFLALPPLPGGALWTTEIAVVSTNQALRVNVAQSLVATWTGNGTNSYMDTNSWSFDGTPFGTMLPTNDSFNLFHVRIDDGDADTASRVFLSANAKIESLEISSEDELTINDGSTLEILNSLTRPTVDTLVNEGTLTISSDGLASTLKSEGDLALTGSGTIRLSGDGQSRIEVSLAGLTDAAVLTNGIGHRIEGEGRINVGRLTNFGTITANGSSPLILSSERNDLEGVLEATGSGHLIFEPALGATIFGSQSITRATNGGRMTIPAITGGHVEILSGGLIETDRVGGLESALISGGGSRLAIAGTLSNPGRVDVTLGGRVSADSLFLNSVNSVVHIGPDAEVETTGTMNRVRAGTLELDGGVFTSASDFEFRSTSGASVFLTGNGSIVLPGQTLSVTNNRGGNISPGLTGIGQLEVVGSLEFDASLLAEISGPGLLNHDRLIVTEDVTLNGGSIQISMFGGFAPSGGDFFDLITGATISNTVPLESFFDSLPTLDEVGAFWVSEIVDSTGAQSLRLLVETARQALWAGGDGDYQDSTQWNFDAVPNSAVFPTNNDRDIFHVAIDGSESGTPGNVSLRQDVTIDALRVGFEDRLTIESGGRLAIENDLVRTGGGRIVNNGEIVIDGSLSLASIETNRLLEISGTGLIHLVGGARLGAESGGFLSLPIVNGAGHTIDGSGTVAGNFTNHGTVTANGTSSLILPGGLLEQRGILEATGSGGLAIPAAFVVENFGVIRSTGSTISLRSVHNYGQLEVTAGGSLVATTRIRNLSGGRVLVGGAGSSISAPEYRGGGVLDVFDGGRAEFTSFTGGSELVRIGQNAEIEVTGNFVSLPRLLELDGGTFRSESANPRASVARIVGSGNLELGSRTLALELGSSLAPSGTSEIGEINVSGNLTVGVPRFGRSSQIEIQLGGTESGEFDVVSIAGVLSIMGSVVVDLIDLVDPISGVPFDPAVGSTFDTIIATQIVDLGATFDLPTFADGRTFIHRIVSTNTNQILRLIVVPEPGTAVLLAMGLTVLSASRRRPRRE